MTCLNIKCILVHIIITIESRISGDTIDEVLALRLFSLMLSSSVESIFEPVGVAIDVQFFQNPKPSTKCIAT